MLHLIFKSPVDPVILDRMAAHDVAVFLESAVFDLLQNSELASGIVAKSNNKRLCILSEDMLIRGIAAAELMAGLEVIDYAGLVELTVENPLIQSWC